MRSSVLIATTLISSFMLFSCSESNDSILGLDGLNNVGISGVRTKNADVFNSWEAGPTIYFNCPANDFGHWILTVGEGSGTFSKVNSNNDEHWRGIIMYKDKDKFCKEYYYVDSLKLDIVESESGWGEATFRTVSLSYKEDELPSSGTCVKNTYYINPEVAGNINRLNVSDANHNYILAFKTFTAGDYNSWKMVDNPQGWMNGQARMCLLMVPILYTAFQQ